MNDEERLYLYQAALKLAITRNSLVMRGKHGKESEVLMQMINDIAGIIDEDDRKQKGALKNDEEGNT